MKNLLEDLSILTTIAKYNLDNLTEKSISIITHDVLESMQDGEDITSIDIGIGVLNILHNHNEIKYKFVPSKKLDDNIYLTCKTGESKLSLDIDTALGERIQSTYKDLF